jgi:excisionase family DNA binding protein
MENIVTAEELAKYLKIKKSTIYRLASQGKLPGFKIRNSWRFAIDEILMLWLGGKIEKRTATTLEKNGGTNP